MPNLNIPPQIHENVPISPPPIGILEEYIPLNHGLEHKEVSHHPWRPSGGRMAILGVPELVIYFD